MLFGLNREMTVIYFMVSTTTLKQQPTVTHLIFTISKAHNSFNNFLYTDTNI